MTDATLTLTITLNTDEADGGGIPMGGLMTSLESQGIHPDAVTQIILVALHGRISMEFREEIEKASPLLNEDVVVATAGMNARLRLVDEIVHLPDVGPAAGFELHL